MKNLRSYLALTTACAIVAATAAQAGDFKVGAAALKITPPNGTPMAGFFSERPATGVSDDLYAKAIVVEQNGAKAAFVGLDLAFTVRPGIVAARKLIAERCGIPPESVMISATHTHSGPVQARDNLMDDITGARQPLAVAFVEQLPALIARAVTDADAKLAPARASATVAQEQGINFNRRYWMKDGTFAWQPRKGDPHIERPAGPIDPELGICYFESNGKSRSPVAAYMNFAMHPHTMRGSAFSADYPGRLAKRLAEYKGSDLVTLFANGCSGNLDYVDRNWADPQVGPSEADRLGTLLAAGAFRAWPKLQPLKTFPPRARTALVVLPRRPITDAQVAEARATMERRISQKLSTPTVANAVCILDTHARKQTPLEVEVQAIAFSDELAIVSLPGEMFVELGLALKKASPFKYTFITELANGSIGYIPNRSAYAEGQYEVVSSRCAPGSGEMLVEAAVKLLKELRSPDSAKNTASQETK